MDNTKPKVEKATQEYIDDMKGKMRKADQEECLAMAGLNADQGLQVAFDRSVRAWAVRLKENTICCFGVSAKSVISHIGVPWLLATDEIKNWKLGFAHGSRKYVAEMLKLFPRLENYVDQRNELSVKWLRWCGFTLRGPVQYGVNREYFYRFWKEA